MTQPGASKTYFLSRSVGTLLNGLWEPGPSGSEMNSLEGLEYRVGGGLSPHHGPDGIKS